MAPTLTASRRTPAARRRGRPSVTAHAVRVTHQDPDSIMPASEPPPKRRRLAPGALAISTHLPDAGDLETPVPASAVSGPLARTRSNINASSPSIQPRPYRTTRGQGGAEDGSIGGGRWGTAAAVAASVKQAEDYKPREERGWEEFHPNLDIEIPFMVFRADQVDSLPQEVPVTPAVNTPATPLNGTLTPPKPINPASTGTTPNQPNATEVDPFDAASVTPSRRPRRSTREMVSFSTPRADSNMTPRTPRVLPIQNQTPKERLDLKLPSYRRTNRIELFESKTFGQARYVDKAMSNVGYQESDQFLRPDRELLKTLDGIMDDDPDQPALSKSDDYGATNPKMGRVEYDMDEQDDMWLEHFNVQRKQSELPPVTREVFEITMTKIEKEWHALEKRIPKPNPKPPQTHRPRSGSAAAVNGEQGPPEEPDSKCAICDDGDCENTNAIVFCDGCNLAVHQECYGVPFIPEGQWLCRKCQLCGRGVPTCIFCPNTDGAFKQSNASRWAHLLCAMWIPEVSLGNHTFMEPVMDVEKVPKTRWKLNCYICNQKMGACIQCSNKNCYQAFHPTCARRARLCLKMKTSQGVLAVLDGAMIPRAFCDKHCPAEYAAEHDVRRATRAAKKFYKRNMRGRIWADNHAIANVMAAQQRQSVADQPQEEANVKNAVDKKKAAPPKNVWRLPSGAPVIPHSVFEKVDNSIQRFNLGKRKDFVGDACRYWTMKREARRGAALLKRLQLQMESFSSMELTRRNFAAMGATGKGRLARRIDFAEKLVNDLGQLRLLSDELQEREKLKVEAAELEQHFVDEVYFPASKLLSDAIGKAIVLDKDVFEEGLAQLQTRVETRHHVTSLAFAHELSEVINAGIHIAPSKPIDITNLESEPLEASPARNAHSDIRERRRLGKRIFKAVQPFLENGLRVEAEICNKPYESLQKELEALIEAGVDGQPQPEPPREEVREEADTIMVDAPDPSEITVRGTGINGAANGIVVAIENREESIEVNTSNFPLVNGNTSDKPIASIEKRFKSTTDTPPDSTGYASAPRSQQDGPPTPPQSNGSLGNEPQDSLTEGGIVWYLRSQQPKGTSILEEHWAGRDAVRMLSEDLTDLDDDEFKGLGADVDSVLALPPAIEVEVATTLSPAKAKAKGRETRAGTRRTSGRRR